MYVQSAVKREDIMLTKFETKSNRVKGLAFHPKRSVSACVYWAMSCCACSLCLMLVCVQALDLGISAQWRNSGT